ncbi:MAG: hypothetical protein K9J16_11225 [Melioribacteraceae bacterium]|nr:hypothetical protein [Melioribacteraceae bacterium]MCF8353581.1 hypothetical protein [Melioribacteraceae bacterium]MCF8393504.1 hypothetical protein [Melioribacteraceae bacterium]MCF8419314.1 hypothetical protein [Melioribacteraceae bacterium]
MKIKLFFIVLIVFISSCLLSKDPDSVNVKFIVYSENVESGETIYIAGSHPKLGGWRADGFKLTKSEENEWIGKLTFLKNISIEFKLTKGSWDKEALNEKKQIPKNHVLKLSSDTTFEITVEKWSDDVESLTRFHGQITGTVHYHRNLTFEKLLPRDVLVWLPPGYDENPNKHYPVLYMHDGQNLFDPSTSSFGVDWQMDETADSLITQGIIEPLIIVGINNTRHRGPEYSYNDTGKSYMRFIVDELKPMIDETYRTLPGRENTAVAGSSMGGLISFVIAWNYPEVFSKSACFSPAFAVPKRDFYIEEFHNDESPKKDITFYIDNGGIALEAALQPGIDRMIELLQVKGYEVNKDLFFYFDKEAQHTEAAWAERAWRPLKIFFGK